MLYLENTFKMYIMDAVVNFIESIVHKYPVLENGVQKIQETTGIRNRYIIFGLAVVPLVLFLVPFAINLLTIIYPLFMSVKAIEQGKDARTRWLTYWLLFHTLHIVEGLLGWVLCMIGCFSLMKWGYLFWCMAPIEQNGCVLSYGILQPYIMEHIGVADEYIAGVSNQVGGVLKDNEGLIQNVKESAINGAVSFALNQDEQKKSD